MWVENVDDADIGVDRILPPTRVRAAGAEICNWLKTGWVSEISGPR